MAEHGGGPDPLFIADSVPARLETVSRGTSAWGRPEIPRFDRGCPSHLAAGGGGAAHPSPVAEGARGARQSVVRSRDRVVALSPPVCRRDPGAQPRSYHQAARLGPGKRGAGRLGRIQSRLPDALAPPKGDPEGLPHRFLHLVVASGSRSRLGFGAFSRSGALCDRVEREGSRVAAADPLKSEGAAFLRVALDQRGRLRRGRSARRRKTLRLQHDRELGAFQTSLAALPCSSRSPRGHTRRPRGAAGGEAHRGHFPVSRGGLRCG